MLSTRKRQRRTVLSIWATWHAATLASAAPPFSCSAPTVIGARPSDWLPNRKASKRGHPRLPNPVDRNWTLYYDRSLNSDFSTVLLWISPKWGLLTRNGKDLEAIVVYFKAIFQYSRREVENRQNASENCIRSLDCVCVCSTRTSGRPWYRNNVIWKTRVRIRSING